MTESTQPRRAYTPDLRGVAALMSDEAAAVRDQFRFQTGEMLAAIAARHDPDESGQYCITCWDSGDDFRAPWPCDTYQAGMTLALQWLMRRPLP